MTIETDAVKSKQTSHVIGILFVSALAVRIIGIWKGIWLDEAASLFYAESTIPELIQKISLGNAPPLYYLVLKVWISIFGLSEISLRLPSVISTLAGLIVIYQFLKKFGAVSGTVGAMVIACSPLSIYYSQEARNYSLLFFFVALYIYCYGGFIHDIRKKRYLAGVVTCSFFLCLTHNIGFFFVAGMQISLLLIKPARLRVWWFGGHVILLVLLLPWLVVLFKQVSQLYTLAWFLPIWESKSVFAHFFSTFSLFCVGPYPPYMAINTFSNTIATILSIPFFLIAIYGYMRNKKNPALNGLLFGAVLAVLLLFLFSIIKKPIYIPGRSDYFLYPVYVIFLSLGIGAIKPKVASGLIMTVIFITSVLVLVPYYGNDAKNSSKKFVGQIANTLKDGDMLIATGLTFLVSEYYLKKSGIDANIVTYPESTQKHPGFFSENEYVDRTPQLIDESQKLLIRANAAIKMRKKVYVILTPHKINGVLLTALSAELALKKVSKERYYQSLMGTPITLLALEEKN